MGERGGRRGLWMLLGAGAVIVAAAVAGVLLLGLGGASSTAQTLEAAGCTLETLPGQGQRHIEHRIKGFKYNSFPPTSGPHFPVPAPWGVYTEPVDQIRLIHNLEHGGIVIQYGSRVPKSQVNAILAWYQGGNPNGIVIAPLPALRNEISLGAWTADKVDPTTGRATGQHGHLAKCGRFETKTFDAFLTAYGFKGPQRFPRAILTPGT